MKYILLTITLISSTTVLASGPKNYQVTGPVIEVRDDTIVIQKNEEKWEIGRDKDTKGGNDVKVGDKVSVQYTINAKSITKK